MKAFIYSVLIVGILAIGAHSLKCYVCTNQNGEKGCGHGSDVDPNLLIECQSPETNKSGPNPPLPPGKTYTVCRKMVTKVDFDVNDNKATEGDGIIKRSCGYDEDKYVGECYYRGGLGGRIDVCTCKDKEGCNGSNQIGTIGVVTILVPILLVFVQALRS